MENEPTKWYKKHLHKFGYALLLLVILILAVAYSDLKNNKNITTNLVVQENSTQQQPVAVEPVKIEEVNVPDTIPPKIESFCFGALKKNEERVCIRIDTWSGYLDSVNSIPITGKIEGDVKSVTVDGKKITWDENKDIYQRINLYVYGGLNKYKVVAEDMNGNKSTGYIETTAQNNSNDINVNLNE